MLNITFIKENPQLVIDSMNNKGENNLRLFSKSLIKTNNGANWFMKIDLLRAKSNKLAKQIGVLMASGKKEEAQAIIHETSKSKDEVKKLEDQLNVITEERTSLLLRIPNVAHPSVPIGHSEEDNQVYGTWGSPDTQSWLKPHWDILERYGWLDFERGVKVTGAGFPFYLGPLAQLQRALIHFYR